MGGLKKKKQSRIWTHRSQSSKNPAALNSSSIMSSKSNPSCCTRETIIPISPMNLNKVYDAFTLPLFKIVSGGFNEFTKISRGRLAFHKKRAASAIQAREPANGASLHCRVRWHDNTNRDFKIGHYGHLGRLDRCHVTQNTRDLLPSFFLGRFVFAGFVVVKTTVKPITQEKITDSHFWRF